MRALYTDNSLVFFCYSLNLQF